MDPEERRGGKGGGKDPPMSECRRWMRKIEVPGKDYSALADSAVDDAGDENAENHEEYTEEQEEQDEGVGDSSMLGNVQTNSKPMQSHEAAVIHQISASTTEGSSNLGLAMSNDRQFTSQTSDVPFGRSGLQSAFEMPFGTYLDSNSVSFITPRIDLAYSRSTLSSSAPAAPSFLSSNSADAAQTDDTFTNGTPSLPDPPSAMSSTRNAHTLEEFSDFQTSYVPGNVSYGMSSSNNPYGLLDFPPFH